MVITVIKVITVIDHLSLNTNQPQIHTKVKCCAPL